MVIWAHPICVEIRVVPIFPAIRGHTGNIRSDRIVAVRQVDVEDETTVLVWGTLWTDNHCLYNQFPSDPGELTHLQTVRTGRIDSDQCISVYPVCIQVIDLPDKDR